MPGTHGTFRGLSWRQLDGQAWQLGENGGKICSFTVSQHLRAGSGWDESVCRGPSWGTQKDKDGKPNSSLRAGGLNRCANQNENIKHPKLSCLAHDSKRLSNMPKDIHVADLSLIKTCALLTRYQVPHISQLPHSFILGFIPLLNIYSFPVLRN